MQLDISQSFKDLQDVYEFSITESIEPISIYGETIEVDPVDFNGFYTVNDDDIIVSGELTTTIHGKCGVCLKAVSKPITAKFNEVFVKLNEYTEKDESDEVFYYTGKIIDITDAVLLNLTTQIPMKFKCSTECENQNLYIDEDDFEARSDNENPFNVLQDFFKNDEEV